jgi:hypothetical protein
MGKICETIIDPRGIVVDSGSIGVFGGKNKLHGVHRLANNI